MILLVLAPRFLLSPDKPLLPSLFLLTTVNTDTLPLPSFSFCNAQQLCITHTGVLCVLLIVHLHLLP